MPHAPQPTRASDTLTLTFGLVALQVNMYSAVSEQGVPRKQYTADGHPVGMKTYDKVTGDDVDRADIVKKIATEHGMVTMADEEIEGLLQITPKTLKVLSFQPQHLFYAGQHYVPRSLHYLSVAEVRTGRKKSPNAAGNAAFALIMKAMREKGVVAVCELTSRGIPRPAILLPNGQLWTVYYTAEVRERIPLPDVELNPALVAQGVQIIESMFVDEPTDLVDERMELVMARAEEKAVAGEADVIAEAPAPAQATGLEDLMSALQASVEQQAKGA